MAPGFTVYELCHVFAGADKLAWPANNWISPSTYIRKVYSL